MRSPRLLTRLSPLAFLAGAVLLAGAAAPAAASAASVSANWAGYVALPKSSQSFSSISGSWTQPSVTCAAGRETFSAVWVGLGGYHVNAKGLEQIGTEADCSRNGQASYSTWYELIPAAPVSLKLKSRPGDAMVASVTVRGHVVTLRLRDLTTGARFSLTTATSHIDTSSADWVIEAPSSCFSGNTCETLPLSDFSTVAFSSATATLGGQTAPIDSPAWSNVALELRQGGGVGSADASRHARAQSGANLVAATPSGLSGSQGAFSVRWQQQPLQGAGSASGAPPTHAGFGRLRAF